MTNLPISSLRYYDKEGFFPNLEKQSGIRRFSKAELDSIRMNSKYKAKCEPLLFVIARISCFRHTDGSPYSFPPYTGKPLLAP